MAGILLLLAGGCRGTGEATLPPQAENPSVVAVYNGETLTLDEFEARYRRSAQTPDSAVNDSLSAYEDFLERYVNFRLKILAAEEAGIPQDSSVQAEINAYRTQFARPYLMDKEVTDPIVEELYERGKEMIDVSHILIRVEPEAAPSDTLEAYNRLAALVDSVEHGAPFGDIAERHSEDPSASSERYGIGYRGHLGFFSAGRMVKAFEDQAYQTPGGEMSPIFRTQYGYHVLRVHDRRPTPPDIDVAHIMIRPDGTTPEDSASARAKIQALQDSLAAGRSFEELARAHSADARSARNGGELGTLTYDNYQLPQSFREAAFALEHEGDVSDVVETQYGLHLIKLLSRDEPASYEEAYEELKKTASNLPRMKKAEDRLAQKGRLRHGVTVDTTVLLQVFEGPDADSLVNALRRQQLPPALAQQSVATLGDSTYTLAQLSAFAQQNWPANAETASETALTLIDDFLDDAAITYEALALEHRDEEFRRIMSEFRDGLVLFKLMEDSVWTAASQDTAGLKAYYQAHADRYRFPERTRIFEIASASDSLLNAIGARLDEGLTLTALHDELNADTTNTVTLDTMLVAGSTSSVYDQVLSLTEGERTDPLARQNGHVLLIHGGTVPPRGKTFEEARAEVATDYQEVLEDRLVERLRQRYNAHTFPQRLARALAEPPTTTDATSSGE